MDKGFTLLELIIVVIIMAILSTVALPKLFSVPEKARSAEARIMLRTIQKFYSNCLLVAGISVISGTGVTEAHNVCYRNWGAIRMEDPSQVPGSHYDYSMQLVGNPLFIQFTATRNERGSDSYAGDMIHLLWHIPSDTMQWSGTGVYSWIE